MDVELMRCDHFGGLWPLVMSQCRGLLSFCISDAAKEMLLKSADFVPHLIDGLLLDANHPRKDTDLDIKAAVQRDFADCILQVSLFPPGCEALKASPMVVGVLDALVEQGWTEEARDSARG